MWDPPGGGGGGRGGGGYHWLNIPFLLTLLVSLKETDLCSRIYNIKTSPLGYADNLAVANTDKRKVDVVLDIVNKHSLKWRYYFNADKSAVLVYGESKRENNVNSKNRSYKLGECYVKEKSTYDGLGLKPALIEREYCENLRQDW